MRVRVNDIPIRSKFILQYLLGVLLPIAMLLAYVLTNVTTEIRARETQNAEQSLQRVYSSLVAQFSGVVSLSNAIASDVKLSGLLDRDYRSPIGYYSAYFSSIHPQVNRYLYAYSQYINGIQFYSNNPTLANGGDCLRITEEVRRADWFPISGEATLLCYLRKQVGQTNALQLCISRALDDRAMRHELVLRIDLNMEPIYKLVEQESAFLSVYLVMPDGAAICYPGAMQDRAVIRHELPLPSSAELRVSFGDHTAMKNWRLFAVINSAPMEASIREAIWVGLLIGLVCSLFAGALSLIFARSIILRSNRLLRHMDSMTAEHFSPIDCDVGHDEIGELIKHFNAMGTRLKQLINDLYVLQLHQKSLELENVRAELKYLQAQIDPHFLFNTLNAILVLCVRNGYSDAAEILRALSKILRRMLDTSRDTVTLSEELEFVRMVLRLEQFRFGDKLRYEFDVSDAALCCTVPMMSVQGLVENACKHGVQSLDGPGVVRVSAKLTDGVLLVEVSDNGVGIEPSRLDSLQKQIASPEDMSGSVGLQNIYRRLKLHYGDEVRLILRNAEERGTVASLSIPQEGGG